MPHKHQTKNQKKTQATSKQKYTKLKVNILAAQQSNQTKKATSNAIKQPPKRKQLKQNKQHSTHNQTLFNHSNKNNNQNHTNQPQVKQQAIT